VNVDDAFIDRNPRTQREDHHGDHDAPEIAFAPINYRMGPQRVTSVVVPFRYGLRLLGGTLDRNAGRREGRLAVASSRST
jgi:hypothetical protein